MDMHGPRLNVQTFMRVGIRVLSRADKTSSSTSVQYLIP